MPNTAALCISRRAILGGIAAVGATGAFAAAPPVVTVLGDSIAAGFGLPEEDAVPVQLQAELKRLGQSVRVRNAGVSGDTTSGALRRVNFSVRPDTAVCVVAVGGNDMLRGLEPKTVRANLEKIIANLQARHITVVLAGMYAPPQLGGDYAGEFNAAFADLAHARGVISYPFLLAGVAGVRALNQKDGIHPNAAGARVIARRLAPVVARALLAAR